MKLLNKTAIITGGSNGIGRAIALAFAREGADIIITYHNDTQAATDVVAEIKKLGRKVKAIQLNLSNTQLIPEFVNTAVQFLSRIDILVNNAGILSSFPTFTQIPETELYKVMAINFFAPFILTQKVAVIMQQQKSGKIINISSINEKRLPVPGATHYICSKAALKRLTENTANELATDNICVNAIAPGLTQTKLTQHFDNATIHTLLKAVPLDKIIPAEYIAETAVFLASEAANLMTGTTITYDAGRSVYNAGTTVNTNQTVLRAKL